MIRLGAYLAQPPADPDQNARAHCRLGWRAAYCPPLAVGDADGIAAVRRAFARHDVVIAEVGAWRNLIPPDTGERRANLAYVQERLALAEAVGARCCVDYLGTLEPGAAWSPFAANFAPACFDLAVEVIRAVIDAVRPTRTRFALEMMQWCLPDSVDSQLALLRAVDRPAFAVHLDPVNLVTTPRICWDTGALLRDCFRRLGPWIVSCHGKDVVARAALALHLDECRPGLGVLDYATYLRELDALGRDVPLLFEHLAGDHEYQAARAHVVAVAERAGVAIAPAEAVAG